MIELEMKRLIVTNRGERKIKERKITGELNDVERRLKGLRSPLVAIMKSQKTATMLPIEPTNSPNAKGSFQPPLTGMAENMFPGEKITVFSVCLIPSHSPSSERLSHGVACRFSVTAPSSFFRYSNLFPQCGHLTHRTPGGIFSGGMLFV